VLNNWLIGFCETKNLFVERQNFRLIIQEKKILEIIRKKLKIVSQVKLRDDNYILETTNSRSLENIEKFFKNKFIGIKSFEYKLWIKK